MQSLFELVVKAVSKQYKRPETHSDQVFPLDVVIKLEGCPVVWSRRKEVLLLLIPQVIVICFFFVFLGTFTFQISVETEEDSSTSDQPESDEEVGSQVVD